MATLHRVYKPGDKPQKAGNLTTCQWCNKALRPEDTVWEGMSDTSFLYYYLVCDTCHESAIVH